MRCFKKIHIRAALFPLVFLVGIIIVCFAKASGTKLAISFDFRCGSECTCALDIFVFPTIIINRLLVK
jgi:hypothetical protein